jgi:DNA (cytosine-5)-methyltransferase 1
MRHVTGKEYPLMLNDVRLALRATGKPYIIENVEGAPLIDATLLCGTMFGLKVFRHRLFETSFFMLAPPHAKHSLFGKAAGQGRPPTSERQYMTITGNFSGALESRRAMGIDWMTRVELAQAIPPAYTHFIGSCLLDILRNTKLVVQ